MEFFMLTKLVNIKFKLDRKVIKNSPSLFL